MVNSIANVFVQTFERNVRHLAQQKGSKLRAYCQYRGETSKQHNWERVGLLTAVQKTTRGQASPVNDTPFSRRTDAQTTWNAGDLIEPEDINQMIVDPTSNISIAVSNALGRALDDLVIAAATGNATDGAGAAVALPAAQTVGDGTVVINLDLIALVTQQFMVNNIDPDQKKVFVIGPVQVRQIAEMDKATSSLFAVSKALAETGMVESWMGYRFIYSNRLTVPAAGQLSCLAISEMAMGLHVTKDIWARVEEDPSRSFAWQVYGAFTGGAVRVEDEHIVALKVLNS